MATYLFKDLSGRGITSKLSEEHVRKTWELLCTDNDDETLTLDSLLTTAEVGDKFTTDQDLLIRIS